MVWFGENVPEFNQACKIAKQADLLLVIGTSLQVYPAASLIDQIIPGTPIVLVAPDMDNTPEHVTWHQDTAVNKVPGIVAELIENQPPSKT